MGSMYKNKNEFANNAHIENKVQSSANDIPDIVNGAQITGVSSLTHETAKGKERIEANGDNLTIAHSRKSKVAPVSVVSSLYGMLDMKNDKQETPFVFNLNVKNWGFCGKLRLWYLRTSIR